MGEGLVICGRTSNARANLSAQFRERKVHKLYRAVVHGSPDKEGSINTPIDGKTAETSWRVRWSMHSPHCGPLTSLDLLPVTGRFHQLRRHLAESLEMPILGDEKYSNGQKTLTTQGA